MSSILEPAVFFANLKPNLERRKVLIDQLKTILSGPKPFTVYISGEGNTGKSALLTLIQKITGMVSVPSNYLFSCPTSSDFVWIRWNMEKILNMEDKLNFNSKRFREKKTFLFCSDEFPVTVYEPQMEIVLDHIFPSRGQVVVFSNYKDYEEYIKNY